MRKLFSLSTIVCLLLLLTSLQVSAGTTSVTGTLTDSDSQTWNNCTVTAQFARPSNNYSGPYLVAGASFTQVVTSSCNGSGVFSMTLTDNTTINPGGSGWQFTVCPNISLQCVQSAPITISGGSQSLSTALSAILGSPRISASIVPRAYTDTEVSSPNIGGTYWNITNGTLRVWNGSSWTSGGIIQSATTTLTSAQLKALATSPIQLAAAPGANKAYNIVNEVVQYKPGTTGYDLYLSPRLIVGSNLSFDATTASVQVACSTLGMNALTPVIVVFGGLAQPDKFNPDLYNNQPLTLYMLPGRTLDVGSIATASIAAAGSGYAVDDTGTVSGAGNNDATYKVLTVNGSGAVLTFSITAGGTDYSIVENPVSTSTGGGQAGVGTGFQINVNTINSLQAGDGTVEVTVYYTTITLQ